mgnify:CR=1 FL=1
MAAPAMGAEVLEEAEMEPFVEAVESFAAGKKIALFGFLRLGRRRIGCVTGRAYAECRSRDCKRRRFDLSGSAG